MVEILRNPTHEDLVNAIHFNWRSSFFTQRKEPEWRWIEDTDATYFIRDKQAPMLTE